MIAATKKQQQDFLATIATAARASCAKWGVPGSIVAAQAILESGWGMSKLARECNNFFGIKARSNEAYQQFQTVEFCTIGKGDTLESIAKRFGADVNDIKRLNPGISDQITIGKRVRFIDLAEFRKFPSPLECFDAHGKLLATHYDAAMEKADDPLAFAIELQHGKYATDPNYPTLLATLIKQHGLTRFDEEAAGASVNGAVNPKAKAVSK